MLYRSFFLKDIDHLLVHLITAVNKKLVDIYQKISFLILTGVLGKRLGQLSGASKQDMLLNKMF